MAQPIPIFRGTPEHGKIRWQGDDGRRWAMALGMLEGKESEFTARAKRRKRSLSQNSYYWGIVVAMLAEAAGYSPEEMHDALKFELLRVHGDSRLPTARSTTELTTVEMEDYA